MAVILMPGVMEAEYVCSLICKLFQFVRNKPKVAVAMPPVVGRIKVIYFFLFSHVEILIDETELDYFQYEYIVFTIMSVCLSVD